jgi:hypothetical protein
MSETVGYLLLAAAGMMFVIWCVLELHARHNGGDDRGC